MRKFDQLFSSLIELCRSKWPLRDMKATSLKCIRAGWHDVMTLVTCFYGQRQETDHQQSIAKQIKHVSARLAKFNWTCWSLANIFHGASSNALQICISRFLNWLQHTIIFVLCCPCWETCGGAGRDETCKLLPLTINVAKRHFFNIVLLK